MPTPAAGQEARTQADCIPHMATPAAGQEARTRADCTAVHANTRSRVGSANTRSKAESAKCKYLM